MREYYERIRPRLATTETTLEIVDHLLDAAERLLDNAPAPLRWTQPIARVVARRATIATLPQWMRRLAGIKQSRAEDAAVIALVRAGCAVLTRHPEHALEMVRRASPNTAKVVGPALLGIAPVSPVVVDPADAWKRSVRGDPRQQYAAQLAAREARQPEKAPLDPGTGALAAFA